MAGVNFYKGLLDYLYDGVYFVDREGRITYWNKAAEKITGYSRKEVIGKQCSDNLLMHLNDQGLKLCLSGCPLKQSIRDGHSRTADVYLHHKEGFRLPVAVRVAPLRNANEEIIGAVELFSDNSVKIAAFQKMKELEGLVFMDQLTEIANRKHVEIFIQSRLEEMLRYTWPFGVLFFDIDHFKKINDSFGHDIGDRVLKMVAKTLSKSGRSFDLVGRWGGEEFIFVIINTEQTDLFNIADRIRKLISHSELILDNKTISVTISIGGTISRQDDTVASIVRRADQAMYQSKIGGRNRVTIE